MNNAPVDTDIISCCNARGEIAGHGAINRDAALEDMLFAGATGTEAG